MKRTLLFFAVTTLALSQGCTAQCGSPTNLNANTYLMFATVQQPSKDPSFTDGPNFWSYGSPSNGQSRWTIKWGASDVGAINVLIDGQKFSGAGEWDPVECGNIFINNLGGKYTDESSGSTHDFKANMVLTVYGNEIGGEMRWAEAWQSPDGDGGQFKADVQLTGALLGG